jgi:hypothetical protein
LLAADPVASLAPVPSAEAEEVASPVEAWVASTEVSAEDAVKLLD